MIGLCLSGAGHLLAASPSLSTGWDRMVEGVVSGAVVDVPPGFEAVMGYSPVLEEGRLVKPDGGCSTPFSLEPSEFSWACRAHDFGYDMLRFGERTGRSPSPHLRRAIDAQFHQDMMGACRDNGCRLLAHVFGFGVGLNSLRQGYAAPTQEPLAPWIVAACVVLVLSLYRETDRGDAAQGSFSRPLDTAPTAALYSAAQGPSGANENWVPSRLRVRQ